MLAIAKTALQALPYVISGAQIVFTAYKQYVNVKPGEQIQVPTGYAVSNTPTGTGLQISSSPQCHKQCCSTYPTRYIVSAAQQKQIVARITNNGRQTITIKKGQQICKGVLVQHNNMIVSSVINGVTTIKVQGYDNTSANTRQYKCKKTKQIKKYPYL